MSATEQRTIRLSLYHIKILDQIQESLGLNFSDAIRHLIVKCDRENREDKKVVLLLKQFSDKMDRIENYPKSLKNDTDPIVHARLNRMERNIFLIKEALGIIGGSDPRTKTMINDLLMDNDEES